MPGRRAGLTFRGARGILSARGLWTLNSVRLKKYSVVFHALKNFLLYLEKKKELYISNLTESEIQPSLYH
jgi:hypothetical protein